MTQPDTDSTGAESGEPRYQRGHPPKDWPERCLDIVRLTRNVSLACRQVGVDRGAYYDRLGADPAFRKAHDEAILETVSNLESTALQKAMAGNPQVMMFLLRAWKPEVYNVPARTQLSGPNDGPITIDAGAEILAAIDRIRTRVQPGATGDAGPAPDATGGGAGEPAP